MYVTIYHHSQQYIGINSGNGVIPAPAPRMTPRNSLDRQPQTTQRAMFFQCLHGIFGTRRRIATGGRRPRRNTAPVEIDRQEQQPCKKTLHPDFLILVCFRMSVTGRFNPATAMPSAVRQSLFPSPRRSRRRSLFERPDRETPVTTSCSFLPTGGTRPVSANDSFPESCV